MPSPTSCSKKLVTVPLVLSRAARRPDGLATRLLNRNFPDTGGFGTRSHRFVREHSHLRTGPSHRGALSQYTGLERAPLHSRSATAGPCSWDSGSDKLA
jgi:hypothetical protein